MPRVLVVFEFGLDITEGDLRRWIDETIAIGVNTVPLEDGIALFREDKRVDWEWPDTIILVGEVVPPNGVNVYAEIKDATDHIASITELINEIYGDIPDVDEDSGIDT